MRDLNVELLDNKLEGYSIALCVTGGIAAIETPQLARHLRRYGARVKAYTTQDALKFIGKTALEWATEGNVVDELSGLAEHICEEDIIIVAPATLNTINKISYGMADNPVTCLVASALGQKKPIYIVPTMHKSLFENPILKQNLKKAEELGFTIVPPRMSEGKAKFPKVKEIGNTIMDYSFHHRLHTSSPIQWIENVDIDRYLIRQANSCNFLMKLFGQIIEGEKEKMELKGLFEILSEVHNRQKNDIEEVCEVEYKDLGSFYFDSLLGEMAISLEEHPVPEKNLIGALSILAVGYMRGKDRYELLQGAYKGVWEKFYDDANANAKRVVEYMYSNFLPHTVYSTMQRVLTQEDKLMQEVWKDDPRT